MLGLTTTDDIRDLSDEEVLARSRREPWLFAALLERYQEAFLRKARSILWSPEDAEEVVQDAFTKIYINADKFEVREGAKFSSWAYTILINTALTRYSKCVREGKRVCTLDPELESQLADTSAGGGRREDSDAIERVLALMPGHLASVLRMHYLERWSHKDIAAHTGETVSAIKARIHRAKAYFKTVSPDGDVIIRTEETITVETKPETGQL